MAKQNFTTGQVLTAAQMTSLQQTAMGGGSPSTKTASYVLVAADAGTVIQMNSASATTITVNTSLFSAGDSVQIQNIGSGTTTITAGTATVNSAGSLAVTQYDGGFLYFSSASSAIWFDYTQPGTTSPLTTKGDLYTRTSSADARLAVGTNGQTLVADSAEATGLKWVAASSGAMTLIIPTSTANSGGSVSTSGGAVTYSGTTSVSVNGVFTSTYANYLIVISSNTSSTNINNNFRLRASGNDTSTNYNWGQVYSPYAGGGVGGGNASNTTEFIFAQASSSTQISSNINVNSPQKAENTSFTSISASRTLLNFFAGLQTDSTQFDGFTVFQNTGTQSGVIRVYGLSN